MNSMLQKCAVLTLLLITLACDPGMSVHQLAPDATVAAKPLIVVHVKSQNQLIGEKHYAPIIDIENLADSPIRVSNVELIAEGTTFQPRSLGSDTPLEEIAPRRSRAIKVWFELSDPVYKLFHRPAELRIHYRGGSGEQIESIAIIGGPLQRSAP